MWINFYIKYETRKHVWTTMSLLYKITQSLPESGRMVAVEVAFEKLKDLFDPYEVELHGSWLLDLAFQESDIDVAVIASDIKFKDIMAHMQSQMKKQKFSCITFRGRVLTNAEMTVIPLTYDDSLDIDITIQTRTHLEHVFRLRAQLDTYGFHDLYRSIKIILRDNHLYGHKVGGLNSFSIGWMIVIMIEYYRIHSNLLTLHPNWFQSSNDDAHTYTLMRMFCEFYLRMHNERRLLRLVRSGNAYTLEIEPIKLSFDKWKDVQQPWLPRTYLDNMWFTSKTWRYNYILLLFANICQESVV